MAIHEPASAEWAAQLDDSRDDPGLTDALLALPTASPAITPQLMAGAFAPIAADQLAQMETASDLLQSALHLSAQLAELDAPAGAALNPALRIQALQFAAYRLLHELFPPQSSFWPQLRGDLAAQTEALLDQQAFASGQRPWAECDQARCLAIARRQRSLGRTIIAGMALLAQDERPVAALSAALGHYQLALQIWADLLSWKTDLHSGRPSLLLIRVLRQRPAWPSQRAYEAASKQIAQQLYYEHHVTAVIQLGLEALDQTEAALADLAACAWRRELDQQRRRLQDFLRDVYRIIHQNLRRVTKQPKLHLTPPQAATPTHQLLWDGLQFVLGQWRQGFGEARAQSCFPRSQGFKATHDHQAGDVFQRALIADALGDLNRRFGNQLQPVLTYEIDYLLGRQDRDGVRGWRRYPELAELPPDAGTLAQVLQVLIRSPAAGPMLERCEAPLATLLRDNLRPDGSCATWIVPAAGRDAEQERQAALIGRVWASEPDCAVIANLLFALLYDPERCAGAIQRGLYYLEGQQTPAGSWRSTTYIGPFYATWLVIRLLARTRPASPALERAERFLRRSQHADGGWGLSNASDPLSSALAMLGLIQARTDCANDSSIRRGLHMLQHLQQPDDGWASSPFMSNEAQDSLPYASRTVASALVLKALAAWLEHCEDQHD